jgi:hypothetical protein
MAQMWIQMHEGQFAKTVQLGEFGNGTFNNCTNPWQNCTSLNLGDFTNLNPQAVTNAGLPVRYGVYNGAFYSDGNNVSLDPTLVDETSSGWIVAIQEGDNTRQGWEAAVKFNVTKKNSGTDQVITYSPIPDLTDTASPVPMVFSSNSGLPVIARVKSGPAEIVNGKLVVKPFAGDSGAMAKIVIRYGQGGNSSFKTAVLKTDTILVSKTSRLPLSVKTRNPVSSEGFYPNPGSQKVFWKGGQTPERILVCDLSGKEILRSEGEVLRGGLDVSALPTGTYLVRYQTKGEVKSFLWIKN